MAGPFKVTHMLVLSQTDDFVNLRVMRVPRGPTLSFHVRHSVIATPGVAPGSPVRSSLQVKEYTLMRHVHAMQRRPVDVTTAYLSSPLVVLNNFADSAKHLKVCARALLAAPCCPSLIAWPASSPRLCLPQSSTCFRHLMLPTSSSHNAAASCCCTWTKNPVTSNGGTTPSLLCLLA